jgi:hypothetical protein
VQLPNFGSQIWGNVMQHVGRRFEASLFLECSAVVLEWKILQSNHRMRACI